MECFVQPKDYLFLNIPSSSYFGLSATINELQEELVA